jgi:predicted O-methyltransferase YrrM
MLDAKMLAAVDELEAFQGSREDSWNVPRDEGMILHVLALAAGAKTLVEVGTSYGFSGLFLASAARANGGRLHTFEQNEAKHAHARRIFGKAGLADSVALYTGDARERLAELSEGIDFLFLDAAKAQTREYWEAVEGKLARRCTVTVDNTENMAAEMADFVEFLHGLDDFHVCHIPCPHGLELAVRT